MTTLKKITLAAVAVFLFILVLREVGVLDFQYYKSRADIHSNYQWHDESLSASLNKTTLHTQFADQQFPDFPVVVIYKTDTLYNEKAGKSPIIIRIDSITTGFLWTPLYKSTGFTAKATCEFTASLLKTHDTIVSTINPKISGEYLSRGNISITGICSHRQAMSIIKNLIVRDCVSEAKSHFSSLDNR